MVKANEIGSKPAVTTGAQTRASTGGQRKSVIQKLTPETKARKVLMLERARQQTRIRQMEAVRVEMAIVRSVLRELLSDATFVALLRGQGYVTMPRLLRDRLTGAGS
ncbi:hypothetical protein [Paraburkholderia aromaticivorans]|uniref:hypothetical protein n=1 Tax=Paraburkholderia aromaticivorans TaxID=2026199 RepID=UPI001455DDCA|nr:hypothetical protein [Paraburkholderia aromaticivorans]